MLSIGAPQTSRKKFWHCEEEEEEEEEEGNKNGKERREKEEEENEPSLIQTLDPPLFRIKHTFSENSFSASLNINEIDY